MKKTAILFGAALVAIGAQAGTTADLQGNTFSVDTLSHVVIGPGTTQSHMVFTNGSRKFHAYVVNLDRSQGTGMRVKVDVGRDSCQTAEAITSIARRKTTADRQYIAGVNGDFFITSSFSANHEFGDAILGYPNMACATDGKMVAPDMIDWWNHENALFVSHNGEMHIDAPTWVYRLYGADGSEAGTALAINYPRHDNELMLYNSYAGTHTKTTGGREIVLDLAEGQKWCLNGSMTFHVTAVYDKGNNRIPADGLVISMGPDCSNPALEALTVGDPVTLAIECALPTFSNYKPDISEICGGDVRILNQGVVTTQATRWINTPSAQYSRSLVGYSEDRNHLVMCSVDAGYAESSGVTYYEAADLMRFLGCYDALDLDGGGSTAMWTHSHGIVNHLRDGSERAVGNGLFVVLDAPADKAVASLRFADHAVVLPQYGLYKPVVYGYNKYGQLVDTDVAGFTLSAAADLGEVTADGLSLLASGSGTHALSVSKDGMTATVPVTVDASQVPSPRVASVLMDNLTPWQVELQSMVKGSPMAVAPMAFSWATDNEGVATVDADGTVSGLTDGLARVTGSLNGTDVTVDVTVECPTAHTMPVFGPIVADEWKLSQISCKNVSLTAGQQPGQFAVDFTVSSVRGPRVTMTRDTRLFSRPDAVRITVDSGEGKIKNATLNVAPGEGARPTAIIVDVDANATQPMQLTFDLSAIADLDAIDSYPMTIRSLSFVPEGKTGTYHYEVSDIVTVYNKVPDGVHDITAPGTDADASAPVEMYDLSGRRVHNPAPGIYIVRQGSHVAKRLIK